MRLIVLPLIALSAACAGDAGSLTGASGGAPAASLSFMTSSPGALSSATRTTIVSSNGADTLIITRAQVVFSRLELVNSSVTSCDTVGDDHNCAEVERSFVLVDLPVDSGVKTVINTSIPTGTYVQLEAKLRVPSSNDAKAAVFLASHPEFTGANVRVEGTFRGEPFVYAGSVESKLELSFSPPLTVDSTGINITVGVDLSQWFVSPSGALIDPATAVNGGANAAFVVSNIRQSFRAFRDDHRNGHDDGADDHGHDGAGHDDGGHGNDDGAGHDINDDHGRDG